MIISHLSKKEINTGYLINFDLYQNVERIANIYIGEETTTEFGNVYNMDIHAYSTDETLCYDYYMDREIMFKEMELSTVHALKFINELGNVVYEDTLEEDSVPTIDDIINDDGHYIKRRVKLIAKKDLISEVENKADLKKPYIKSLTNKS